MKTNTYRILNFIGINLLLLALYLNFIHEDNNTAPEMPVKATKPQSAASSRGTDQHLETGNPTNQKSVVLN